METIEKPIQENKPRWRNVYRVRSANVPQHMGIEVDVSVLDGLAARYGCPHFVISDYMRTDANGITHEVKGWTLHFTHIPYSGLIVAYEKNPEATL